MKILLTGEESLRLEPTPGMLTIEAASPESWYKWVGSEGVVMGLDRFGASAPYETIYKELGLTVDKIVADVKEMVR